MTTEAAGELPQGELDETKKVEVLVQEEPKVTEEEVSQDETSKEEAKKPTGFARRWEKHAAELEAARLESEYWKKQAMTAAVTSTQEKPAVRSSRLDFESDDEWLNAKLEAEKKKWIEEANLTTKQQQQFEQVQTTFLKQVEDAKKEYKDWDEVFAAVQEAGLTLPLDCSEFIIESPVGAKIAYNLSKNEEEFERFLALSPKRQLAELGKMEDRLSVKAAPEVKKISSAPPKLAETKGSGTVTPLAADRFKSKEAWRQWRAETTKLRK